ncbi:MAG: chemotaxis protein CheA, partial [Sulfurimonas sp.]|nr:chemotaxis protein CheA [Sulfurimonas sp.]
FAHIAESLLSEVRESRVTLDADMIEIFFKTKDHMQTLVDLALEGKTLDDQTQAINDELLKILVSMMPNAKSSKNSAEVVVEEITDDVRNGDLLWHVSFRLKPHFFSTGMEIISILNFFDMLGSVEKKLLIDDNVPKLDSLNPTEAYIGYEILFSTDSPYADIEEIFEFIMDDVELEIFKADDLDMLQALVDANKGLLEKLNTEGFSNVAKLGTTKEVKVEPKEVVQEQESSKPSSEVKTKEKKKSFSLRVDSSKIDQLINQISEMVIANAKITQRADVLDDNELGESATILSDMLEEIRTGVMNIRMVQVGDSFNKFKRIVHDVAKKVDKQIDFQIIGGETELDKMVVEKIS